MSNGESIDFIDIGNSRSPPYSFAECDAGHIHARIKKPEGGAVDLVFLTPEDAYDFAQALLRSYDRAAGIAGP